MKKRKSIAIVLVLLILMATVGILAACSKKEEEAPPEKLVPVSSQDFTEFLVDSALASVSPEDHRYFSLQSRVYYDWSDGDRSVGYYIFININLDLDMDNQSKDNAIEIEIREKIGNEPSRAILGIYYQEEAEGYDYSPLLVRVGDYKFHYEAASLKDIARILKIEMPDTEFDDDAIEELKSTLSMILGVAFKDFHLSGDRTEGSMSMNVEDILSLFKMVLGENNINGELDQAFQDANINLTVKQLLDIYMDFSIDFNFEFLDGRMTNMAIVMDINKDHYIDIDTTLGDNIIDIKLAKGRVTLSVEDFVLGSSKIYTSLPSDILDFKKIGLINLDINGDVNFYTEDGTVNNGGKTTPILLTIRADINPFVIFEGLNAENIDRLGVLHIRVAGEKGTHFELVFDPKSTGNNSLYLTVQSIETALVKQDLTFELEATIEFLTKIIVNTEPTQPQSGRVIGVGNILDQIAQYIQISTIERDGQKNIVATIDLVPIREAIDSLLPEGVDILGTRLMLGNIVLGSGNVKATIEFTHFNYGGFDSSEYDATKWMNKSSISLVKEIVSVSGGAHKTEYTLGEALQYGIDSTVSVKVKLLNGKTAVLPLSTKVIEVKGYDSTKLGEQTITLTLRDNNLFASIIAGAIGTAMPLPLGVMTVTYKINVVE